MEYKFMYVVTGTKVPDEPSAFISGAEFALLLPLLR
jgi:hypothetical protein